MSKQYKTAVVIGRFQPFHIQHAALIEEGFKQADQVVVLVGGSFKPRTPKDPFTYYERASLIQRAMPQYDETQLIIMPIRDYIYSDSTWAQGVQSALIDCPLLAARDGSEVVVVGCNKDESSFYLQMFPQWALHEVPYDEKVDATEIREVFFNERSWHFLEGVLAETTMDWMKQFQTYPCFSELQTEKRVVEKYRKAWEAAPYAPTFVTTDAVVIQSGHILLVTRGGQPGRGLLALPGGFLEQNERIVDGVIRELREETKIKVPASVLRGSIRETAVFDAPKRSSRGRTITHASLIVLPDGPLPKVKGSDDAMKAAWYQLGSLQSENFFEDHWDVVEYFKARV